MRFWGLLFTILIIQYNGYSQDILPKIYLTGDFGNDYQQGTFTIVYADGTMEENLTADIKWRGGTTNAEGKHKRNYKIKFDDNHSFFGLRNDNKWILDAGQADIFRLRNRIATELWNDFSNKPYYTDKEPKGLSGVRGNVVELYLNDEYRGIYCLTECIDRKQMKLKKFEKDGTIHGCLWKSKGYSSSQMYSVPDSYDNSLPMMDVFEVEYPDLDDLSQTDYSVLWNALNFVVNSDDNTFINKVDEYFDLPVIIDYYLFINVLGAIDNQGKNMYWAVYDKEDNKKITPAVWDLDMTVGSVTLEKYNKKFSSPEYNMGDSFNLIKRLKELNVNNFNTKLFDRYAELRISYFAPNNLIERYQSYYHLIKNTGAAEREQNKWSNDSDIEGMTIDFDTEIIYICNWIEKRIKYLDNVYNYTSSYIIDIDKNKNNNRIYSIIGTHIKTPINKGIYIINGKKYVVK